LGAQLAASSATATIEDDETSVQLSIADVRVVEGAGVGALEVTLSSASSRPVSFSFAATAGTATAADFALPGGTATVPAGQLTTTIPFTIVDDALDEDDDETFTVTLSNPSEGAIADGQATVTIADDDDLPTLRIADASASEADGTLALEVTLSGPSARPITVDYATSDGSARAGQDYATATGTLRFAPGQTAATLTLDLIDDDVVEPVEVLSVTLSNAVNAGLADASATATLLDDDGEVQAGLADIFPGEGDRQAIVSVLLSRRASFDVRIPYTTRSDEAVSGVDFVPTSGTLVIPAGSRHGQIAIPLIEDELIEAPERFLLALDAPSFGLNGQRPAFVTIYDNDAGLSVSARADVARESGRVVPVRIALNQLADEPVRVRYTTVDGTARAGEDYEATEGEVIIRTGTFERIVEVRLIGDDRSEDEETFTLTLTSALIGANSLSAGAALVTIRDDDAPPTLSAETAQASVRDSVAVVTLRLSAPSGRPVAVRYRTQDSTAVAGTDYVASSGEATFAPGETELPLAVRLLTPPAGQAAAPVAFSVVLTDASAAVLGTEKVDVTLVPDTPTAENDALIPTDLGFALLAPHPVRGVATLSIDVPVSAPVQVEVYDALGRQVGVLVDRHLPAGRHHIEWPADGLPSGLYVLRIRQDGKTAVRTATLIR
jgi:hypothetical protein